MRLLSQCEEQNTGGRDRGGTSVSFEGVAQAIVTGEEG